MVHARRVERWRPVVGLPDGYEVSDLGRVRSRHVGGRGGRLLGAPRIVVGSTDKRGYRRHTFFVFGKYIGRTVHRMVMEAFRGPRPPGKQIAHGDGRPSNCRLTNLKYKTPKANAADMVRHGTRGIGEKNGASKLTNAQARVVLQRALAGENYGAIADEFGISRAAVCLIRKGRTYGAVTGAKRVEARRAINSDASKRGVVGEVLIT